MQLAQVYNNERLKSDNHGATANAGDVNLATSCNIIGCHKKILNCDITGLTCHCCEMITCALIWPAEPMELSQLVNGRPIISLHKEDQNIIKWACLLHDIRKLSLPIIESKDHVHPFKSAGAVLQVFQALNFIKLMNEKDKFAFIQANRLIDESVQPISNKYDLGPVKLDQPVCTVIHSHHL